MLTDELARMRADAIGRGRTMSGRDGLVSRGRLLAEGELEVRMPD
jgi:hypothetical protein